VLDQLLCIKLLKLLDHEFKRLEQRILEQWSVDHAFGGKSKETFILEQIYKLLYSHLVLIKRVEEFVKDVAVSP